MDFNLTSTPEEERFQEEVNDFLEKELTDELRRQHAMDKGLREEARAFNLKLGAKGWLGMSWPKEYGGGGQSIMYDFILVQEFARHEAHVPNEVALFMAGPQILEHGSEQMKNEFLPRIARGEIEFGLGYSEPPAGSDLMAMQMRAVEDGDYYVINGQKTFNTESHYADYHWLAVKTDPDAPRHQSISLFVVDQRGPGITIRPIETMGGERSNEVFYDDVRVHKSRLVGERGKGFAYMIGALNYERLMFLQAVRLAPVLNRIIQYAKETRRNGRLLADDPFVQQKLAQMAVDIEIGRCLEYHSFAMLLEGRRLDYEAGMFKVFVSESRQRFAQYAMEILGFYGRVEEGSKWALFKGEVARLSRATVVDTIGAGTSEILRDLTAMRGLGLPRG